HFLGLHPSQLELESDVTRIVWKHCWNCFCHRPERTSSRAWQETLLESHSCLDRLPVFFHQRPSHPLLTDGLNDSDMAIYEPSLGILASLASRQYRLPEFDLCNQPQWCDLIGRQLVTERCLDLLDWLASKCCYVGRSQDYRRRSWIYFGQVWQHPFAVAIVPGLAILASIRRIFNCLRRRSIRRTVRCQAVLLGAKLSARPLWRRNAPNYARATADAEKAQESLRVLEREKAANEARLVKEVKSAQRNAERLQALLDQTEREKLEMAERNNQLKNILMSASA
uniref:DDT domain-containing protein n=1 Tax=Macrostomum lignano TaxID=282301 RepID=A0A1I8FH03_9PLAT